MLVSPDNILATESLADEQQRSWSAEDTDFNAKAYRRYRKAPYVPWGIEKDFRNLYPKKVEDMYIRQPTFQRVVNDLQGQIKGDGMVYEGPDAEALRQFFIDLGIDDEYLERTAYDIALFNGFASQVIMNRAWTVNLIERAGVSQVQHVKLSKVRAEKVNRETGKIEGYYVTADWGIIRLDGRPRVGFQQYEPRRYESYNIKGTEAKQIAYNFRYSPVTEYYPLPDMESSYEELKLSRDVVAFQRRYVENGMTSSAIIYAPYTPQSTNPGEQLSDEDRARIADEKKKIKEELTGPRKAGQAVVVFFDPRQQQPTNVGSFPPNSYRIEQPPQDKGEDKFLKVYEQARENILTGLSVISQDLIGLPSPTGFSSQADLLLTANELTYSKIVKPKQDVLLRFLNKIASDNGFKSSVGIANSLPVSQQITVEMVKEGIFTADELRELKGYEPVNSTTSGADENEGGEGNQTGNPQRSKVMKRCNFGNRMLAKII